MSLTKRYIIFYIFSLFFAKVISSILNPNDPFMFFRISNILAIASALLYCFISIVVHRGFIKKPESKTFLNVSYIFMGVAFISCINGFLHGWDTIYILYDFLSLFIQGILILFLSSLKIDRSDIAKLLRIVMVLSLLTAVLFKLLGAQGFPIPQPIVNYIFAMLLLRLFTKTDFFILAAVLIISYSELNRAIIASFFVVSLIFSPRETISNNIRNIFLAAMVCFSVYQLYQAGLFSGTQIGRRINEFSQISDINSSLFPQALKTRLFEVDFVNNKYLSGSIGEKLFGFGAGAEIDISNSTDSSVTSTQISDSDSAHNIHIIYSAVLYRYGLIGVMIYVSLMIYIILMLYTFKSRKNSLFYICFLFSAINGFFASSYYFTDLTIIAALVIKLETKELVHEYSPDSDSILSL